MMPPKNSLRRATPTREPVRTAAHPTVLSPSDRRTRLILSAAVAALLATTASARAQTVDTFAYYGLNGTWNNAANWSNGLPAAEDALSFFGGPSNNQLNASFTAQTLSFYTGSATFGIDANTSGTTAQTLALTGGTNANGGTDTILLSDSNTGTITFGGNTSAGVLTVAFGANPGTINVANAAANLVFGASSSITGSNGLTLDGPGTVTLQGTNYYTGPTLISAGTLTLAGTTNGIPYSDVTVSAGATLRVTASGASINSLAGAGNVILTGGNLSTGGDGVSTTFSGVITGGILTKSGAGTLTLTGANANGSVNVNGGTLLLSFGTVSSNILSSTTSLDLGGGILQLSGTGTQTVNGVFVGGITASQVLMGANETLNLGTLRMASTGASVNFNTATGGANASTATVGSGIIVMSGQTAGSAINPGFTVTDVGGFGLATVNASNQIVRSTTTALLPASGASGSTVYQIDNNAGGAASPGSATLAITASQTATSITVDTTAAAGTVTLSPGVVLTNNIWNFGGVGTNGWQINGSSGGAGLMAASGATFYFNNSNTGVVTINTPILANGTNAVYVKGGGTVVFAAANTYTGATFIGSGTLQIPTGGSIATSDVDIGYPSGSAGGALNITGGSVTANNSTVAGIVGSYGTATISSGSWTNTYFFYVSYLGTAILNVTGGSVSDATGYLGYNPGGTGTATVSGGSWTNSSALYIGNKSRGVLNLTDNGLVSVNSGTGTVTLANAAASTGTLNLGTGGAAGTLNAATVTGGSGTAVVNFNQNGTYTFAARLSGSLSVNHVGTGTTILTSSTSNYSGATNVSAGTLLINGSLSGTSGVTVGLGATLGGTGTITPANGGAFTIQTGGTLAPGSGTAAGLSINAATSGAAALSFQSGSTFQLSLQNSNATSHGAPLLTDYSKLTIGTGVSVDLTGATIATAFNPGLNSGDLFPIILDGTAVGSFFANTPTAAPDSAGTTFQFSSNGMLWDINYAWNGSTPLSGVDPTSFAQTTGGQNVALLLVSVPEPGSLTTVFGAAALLLGNQRLRRPRRGN